MTQLATERLYNLLPAIYRERDLAQGEPLRALLAVIEQELELIEADIEGLYDNWFIETCDQWVVPYIGDLLDVRDLNAQSSRTYGQEQRAFVANTLAYRGRKGTAPMLEQLARDITGWRARAVEFFELLATTQNLNHVRRDNVTVDLRSSKQPERLGTPFEQNAAYTAEVRRITSGRGRYNIPNMGLFLWRLQSYPINKGTARAVKGPETKPSGRYYTFNPLGIDSVPLFNRPQLETEITRLAEEINVPGQLRRAALDRELAARYKALLQGQPVASNGYFGDNPVLQIFINGQPNPIPTDEILITSLSPPDNLENAQRNLEQWQIPTETKSSNSGELAFPTKVVAVDPELGRLAFLDRTVPRQVEVSYSYGFSGDIGAGPYEREPITGNNNTPDSIAPITWVVEQGKSAHDQNPFAEAIQAWNKSVQAWENLRNLNCIPLARIVIPKVEIAQLDKAKLRTRFTPGIVSGLTVIAQPGTTEAVVTAGSAVDGQGRLIYLDLNHRLDLKSYSNQTGVLIISYRASEEGPRWQIDILPDTAADSYPKGAFLALARLVIGSEGKIISHSEIDVRPRFTPGMVNGLTVITKPGTLEAIATPGIAVDQQGRPINLKLRQRIDLQPYQGQDVLLVISYKTGRVSQKWQINVISPKDAKKYPTDTYIRLAHLDIPQVKIGELTTQVCPAFHWGLFNGLRVIAKAGSREVIVTPGTAFDSQGRPIHLTINYRVNLGEMCFGISDLNLSSDAQQTLLLVISYKEKEGQKEPRWQITAIKAADTAHYPQDIYLRLAKLVVNPRGKIISCEQTAVRPFRPGVVKNSLAVTDVKPNTVQVMSGRAVNSQGQLIQLKSNDQLNLSTYSGRTLILFISPSAQQGEISIDVVPEETAMGVITLKDNHTYRGNLAIAIPANKQLQIIAASGYRPHLQGNLSVRGTATDNAEPGELILDGLLLEGKLTVLAGNLGRLQVAHCTLVPTKGGLTVEKAKPAIAPEDEDEGFSLIALVMYCLNLIQRFLRLGLGVEGASSQQNFLQLFQLGLREAAHLFSALRDAIRGWQCLELPKTHSDENHQTPCAWVCSDASEVTDEQNNPHLSITLARSICGPIHLADTVSKLDITDSLLDKGAGIGLVALGTAVDLNTTTVFGRTQVGSLEASDSIFTEKVTTLRRQIGCLRFCYIPDNSQTPRRYRCQPDLALTKEIQDLPAAVTSLAIAQKTGQMFAGTAGNGVFYSADNGNNWTSVNTGLTTQNITALGISKSNGQLFAGTVNGIIFRSEDEGKNWVEVNPGLTNTDVTAIAVNAQETTQEKVQEQIFVGTAGGGVLRSSDQGKNWEIINAGLTNTDVTTLAVNSKGQMFIGTAGGGVFHFLEKQNRWESLNRGLTHKHVTAVAIDDKQQLFAGTAGGGVFRFVEAGESWKSVSTGLSNTDVTSLIAFTKQGTGTISSEGTTVIGQGTIFTKELSIGDTITVGERTRIVTEINSESATVLKINKAFFPNLLEATTFTTTNLFAGTVDGSIFRSTDNGKSWVSINTGLSNADVTALAVAQNGQIFAGTTLGSILSSTDKYARWVSLNHGLSKVDEKLLILTRVQPKFTSTDYSQPGYAQLDHTSAEEIRAGGEDGSEMGAFSYLKQPQREANLRASLDEYLRFGLEAGIFYFT
ncbi:MAG TPA: hypothetical protein V6D11_23315 [Waterburya sp.]|jgi:photosystem II stability/assembly factor-like uncharacterized protein